MKPMACAEVTMVPMVLVEVSDGKFVYMTLEDYFQHEGED